MSTAAPWLRSYNDCRREIDAGDLLLFRRRGLIATFGRSVYSHAAKADWWGDVLFCLEVREWYGGRAVTLSSQIQRTPGGIDVFSTGVARPGYNWRNACEMMRRLAGEPYNYRGVLRLGLMRIPFVRLLIKPNLCDSGELPLGVFCSQAVAAVDRIAGGVDPVPSLADEYVEPGDLARSMLYQYKFTVVP